LTRSALAAADDPIRRQSAQSAAIRAMLRHSCTVAERSCSEHECTSLPAAAPPVPPATPHYPPFPFPLWLTILRSCNHRMAHHGDQDDRDRMLGGGMTSCVAAITFGHAGMRTLKETFVRYGTCGQDSTSWNLHLVSSCAGAHLPCNFTLAPCTCPVCIRIGRSVDLCIAAR
jgi:hypothetical protein